VKTPMIDQVFANVSRLMCDTDAIRCEKPEAIALANELRALLAERDRLAGQATEWEGHAQTYEAGMVAARRELANMTKQAKDAWSAAESYRVKAEATTTTPRRLREVTVGEGMKLRWNEQCGPRAEYYTFDQWREANHTQVLLYFDVFDDMRKQPYEEKTLEGILADYFNTTELARVCGAVRAWLATQQGDKENSYPSPEDMACTGKIIRDEFIKAITPEQAVAVLVAHGARRSTAWNSVIATGGGNHAVLILPTATPEGGK